MSKLFQNSGSEPQRRMQEAETLYRRLDDAGVIDSMTDKEQDFVSSVADQVGRGFTISPKALFWLRDICEKYEA